MRDFLSAGIVRYRSLIQLVGLLALAACGGEQQVNVYTQVGKLEFTDPVLEACVLAEARRHDWATSGHMTQLKCSNPDGDAIEELDGIENLVNLKTLDLAHNAIRKLVAALGQDAVAANACATATPLPETK